MFERLFAGSDLLDWPIAAMIFFFVFFAAVILRVYSKKRKNLYEHMAMLPLEEKSPSELANRPAENTQAREGVL